MTCEYCGAKAIHADHVVPKSLAKRHPELPAELTATVQSCGPCNWRKMSRRLVPPSWADKLDALQEALPGAPWRTWSGSTDDPAYREVHV